MALRILLADDSQHAQRDGSRILSELGYDVVTVNNGAAALQQLEDAAFDLVIADTSMPGLTGLEICERIRQRPEWANLPVLLALAAFELFDAGQGRRAGADEVIQKPFIPSALERAVQELLVRAGKLPAELEAPAPAPAETSPAQPTAEIAETGDPSPPPPAETTPGEESSAPPEGHQPESGSDQEAAPAEPALAPAPEPPPAEPGRPRWEIAALEVAGGESVPQEAPAESGGEDAIEQIPATVPALARAAAAASAPAAVAPEARPAALLSGTWLAPEAAGPVPPRAPAEPEDVLLSAWREAMAAPIATAPQVDLAEALNAVDEVLARYLAPMIAGEASEHIAGRLRALAR